MNATHQVDAVSEDALGCELEMLISHHVHDKTVIDRDCSYKAETTMHRAVLDLCSW